MSAILLRRHEMLQLFDDLRRCAGRISTASLVDALVASWPKEMGPVYGGWGLRV